MLHSDPENRASSTKAREQQHTQAIRTDILRQRLHQVAQGAPKFQVVGSGSSLSTSALQALKSGTSGLLTSPEPQCLIGYQVSKLHIHEDSISLIFNIVGSCW